MKLKKHYRPLRRGRGSGLMCTKKMILKMGGFVNEEGKLICHFGNRIDYYPTEGEPPGYDDELLIANAPEWLRFLLSELDREREESRKLWEERDFWKGQYDRQVERSVFLGEMVERLREERDKLIEGLRWYADTSNYVSRDISGRLFRIIASEVGKDYGKRARDILAEIGVTVE